MCNVHIYSVFYIRSWDVCHETYSAAYKLNQQINGKGGKGEKIETIAK